MLPDFPAEKAVVRRHVERELNRLLEDQIGPFARARYQRHHEGNDWLFIRADGSQDEPGYQDMESRITFSRSEIPDMTPQRFTANLRVLARDMAEKKVDFMLGLINQATTKAGNIVEGGGQPLSPELLLRALGAMQLEYDATGSPAEISLIVPPALGKQIRERVPQWDNDPELKRRYDALLVRKRDEWRAREAGRKLVD